MDAAWIPIMPNCELAVQTQLKGVERKETTNTYWFCTDKIPANWILKAGQQLAKAFWLPGSTSLLCNNQPATSLKRNSKLSWRHS